MTGLMTYEHRADTAGPSQRRSVTVDPSVVVRLRVDGFDWAEHVPPVPHEHDVSVSFARSATAARHAEALAELGYRVVRLPRGGQRSAEEFVDMVIYGDTAAEQTSWWRAISALAERVYPLAMGPAARRCADLVAAHVAGRP